MARHSQCSVACARGWKVIFKRNAQFVAQKEFLVRFPYFSNGGIESHGKMGEKKVRKFLLIHHITRAYMRTIDFLVRQYVWWVNKSRQANNQEWIKETITSGCKQAHSIPFDSNSKPNKDKQKNIVINGVLIGTMQMNSLFSTKFFFCFYTWKLIGFCNIESIEQPMQANVIDADVLFHFFSFSFSLSVSQSQKVYTFVIRIMSHSSWFRRNLDILSNLLWSTSRVTSHWSVETNYNFHPFT